MNKSLIDQLAVKEISSLIKATERYVLPKIHFDAEKRAYTLAIVRAIIRINESKSFLEAKRKQKDASIKEINQLDNKLTLLSNPTKYYKLALSHIEEAFNSVDTRFVTGCSDHIFWWR